MTFKYINHDQKNHLVVSQTQKYSLNSQVSDILMRIGGCRPLRNPKMAEMEQDVQGLSSPTACSELGQSQWVVQGSLQPDLNIPKDGDATAFLGNLC